tara:strand:- start:435 stop:614 length:180 start_codon:yes stop_codon:yes gene_type:complete
MEDRRNENPFVTMKIGERNGATCRKALRASDLFDTDGRPLNRAARRMLKKMQRSKKNGI